MFERNDINDIRTANTYGFNDSEIPEPIETWSVEDFEDIVSGHSV